MDNNGVEIRIRVSLSVLFFLLFCCLSLTRNVYLYFLHTPRIASFTSKLRCMHYAASSNDDVQRISFIPFLNLIYVLDFWFLVLGCECKSLVGLSPKKKIHWLAGVGFHCEPNSAQPIILLAARCGVPVKEFGTLWIRCMLLTDSVFFFWSNYRFVFESRIINPICLTDCGTLFVIFNFF